MTGKQHNDQLYGQNDRGDRPNHRDGEQQIADKFSKTFHCSPSNIVLCRNYP